MPELPEVETIVRGLRKNLRGDRFSSIEIFRDDPVISRDPDAFVARLKGAGIENVLRRGKYLLFKLAPSGWLVGHLRMTGKFILTGKPDNIDKYDRLWFHMDSGRTLVFSDMRCFGTLECVESLEDWERQRQLGKEPLSEEFDPRWLKRVLRNSPREVKPVLLDQKLVCGIGNIYASEILFRSRVNPRRRSKRVLFREWTAIVDNTRLILELAIEKNGTSISDFRKIDDKSGEFQNFLQVYDKAGEPCPLCETPIQRMVQQQRSTFFCPQCQR